MVYSGEIERIGEKLYECEIMKLGTWEPFCRLMEGSICKGKPLKRTGTYSKCVEVFKSSEILEVSDFPA